MSESSPELDDFEHSLLRAGRAEAPASGAAVRAAAALGLAATAVAPAAAAAATAGAAARAAAVTGSKWSLIGALGIASVGTGTVAYYGIADSQAPAARGPASPSESAAVAQRSTADVGAPRLEAAIVPPPTVASAPDLAPSPRGDTKTKDSAPSSVALLTNPVRTSALPSPGATVATPASPAATTASSPAADAANGVSIAEEVAVVDRARHSLRQGRAGEALDELDRYQARWPSGTLATDVVVLRVEAELRLGRRAAAKERAKAFIASQASSRYAARLRELFEPGELD